MKTNTYRLIAVIFACLLTGCVSYVGLKPVYPQPNTVRCFVPVMVESLQPTFKWELPASGQNVDLIIWDVTRYGWKDFTHGANLIREDAVYYKENIPGGEHKIEKPLQPDTVYAWSIRPAGTTAWSVANHYSILTYNSGVNFVIRTPK